MKPSPKTVRDLLFVPVATYLSARVVAEVLREKVDAIQTQLLQETAYLSKKGERVTDPKWSWTICDAQLDSYHQILSDIHQTDNPNPPQGHCPALVAEDNQRKAELEIITKAEKLFPEVTNHKLLCAGDGLATRQKYLDILVGLVQAA